MKLIKLIMPSQGDMEVVNQAGGVIWLRPTYFGGECAGPVIQFVDQDESPDGDPVGGVLPDKSSKVEASYRIRIRKDSELRLAKAD